MKVCSCSKVANVPPPETAGAYPRRLRTLGAGAAVVAATVLAYWPSLGGRFIWTQSTELRFPLPISPDLGLSGRTFVDVGALSQVKQLTLNGTTFAVTDDPSPRVSAGFGVSWKTPFGLINIDLGVPIIMKPFDQTQLIRFGFGTRF